MNVYDISLPLHNNMWSYRSEWSNTVKTKESVLSGGKSTVYEMNLFSHTGTYIETSQHKIANDKLLDDLSVSSFFRKVKVIAVKDKKIISKNSVLKEIDENNISIGQGEAVIIANGYGASHQTKDYLNASPSYEPALVEWLIEKEPALLGVDTPIMENPEQPFQPVVKLFEANPDMLLLAPLNIDTTKVKTGMYYLSCAPLKVDGVSGMLCRPLLIEGLDK